MGRDFHRRILRNITRCLLLAVLNEESSKAAKKDVSLRIWAARTYSIFPGDLLYNFLLCHSYRFNMYC